MSKLEKDHDLYFEGIGWPGQISECPHGNTEICDEGCGMIVG